MTGPAVAAVCEEILPGLYQWYGQAWFGAERVWVTWVSDDPDLACWSRPFLHRDRYGVELIDHYGAVRNTRTRHIRPARMEP